MGEWRYNSTILDLGTRWKWMASFTFLPFYRRRRRSRYPLNRRLGGPQSRFEALKKTKILHCRESNPRHPARSPLLYRLSYPNSQQIRVLTVMDACSTQTECAIQPNSLAVQSHAHCSHLAVTSKAWNNAEYQRNMKDVVTQLFSIVRGHHEVIDFYKSRMGIVSVLTGKRLTSVHCVRG
jgi:hypothetical protein